MIISRDKFQHLIVSCAVLIVVNAIAGIWWALIAALIWAFGKEIYDKYHGGIFSWKDILFDMIGIVIGVLIR